MIEQYSIELKRVRGITLLLLYKYYSCIDYVKEKIKEITAREYFYSYVAISLRM